MFKYFTEILTKARSNKSANKPDTELNEFELVGAVFFFFFFFEGVICSRGEWVRFSKNINVKARTTKRLRNGSRERRRLPRRRRRGDVSVLSLFFLSFLPYALDRLTLPPAFSSFHSQRRARRPKLKNPKPNLRAQPLPSPLPEANDAPKRATRTRTCMCNAGDEGGCHAFLPLALTNPELE